MLTDRYNYLRKELIELHRILTEETFEVSIPLSSFMTLKQLENAKENPPLTGFETLEIPVERPFTILRLLQAVQIMGDQLSIGFRWPRRDIPRIYETIQTWIKYWVEIKINASYLRTPSVEELELIEKLAKYSFGAYAHYHYEKVNKTLNVPDLANATLLDVLKGRMMYGADIDEELSYVSHLDEYKSLTGYVGSHSGAFGAFQGLGGL